MTKILAMGLGALMAEGWAASAGAASHIDFSGYYRIMYMSETNTGHGSEPRSFTDSYFQDRLQLDVTFRPTDQLAIHWSMRGPGSYRRWGSGHTALHTRFIYGEIIQDWGTVTVGRLSDDLDVYGLASLGYQGGTIPIYTRAAPFDRADVFDGLRYTYTWDNGFSLLAQYAKLVNNHIGGGQVGGLNNAFNAHSDQDYDRYQLQGAYIWDGGGAALNVLYERNATRNIDYAYLGGYGYDNLNYDTIEQWGLNPAIMHSWGNLSVHFEGMAVWGTLKRATQTAASRDIDGRGLGAYLDIDYNYGPGNATLSGWWVSGTGLEEKYRLGLDPGESNSLANLVGGNFYPLLVAYNGVNNNPGGGRYVGDKGAAVSAVALANNAYRNYVQAGHVNKLALNNNGMDLTSAPVNNPNSFANGVVRAQGTRTLSFNEGTDANHWAVALTGSHAFTDDATLHYALAYLALNHPNYRVAKSATYNDGIKEPAKLGWHTTGYTTQDKDLGFEIDLGLTIQLLDNLSFTSAFGYMFNGDAYKQHLGYELSGTNNVVDHNDTISAVWKDADDSYVWFNSLTFSF